MANYKARSGLQYKVQKLDLVRTSSTVLTDTDLTFDLKVGHSYQIKGYVGLNAHTTPDSKLGLDIGTIVGGVGLWDASIGYTFPAIALATPTGALSGQGTDEIHVVDIVILDITTAGTITLQFAQNTSDGNASTFTKGSYLVLHDIDNN